MEAASSLTIQTEVLGKGLSNTKLEALLNEVPNSPGILGKIARRETLVCTVEEGEVRLLLQNSSQFLPLFLCRVDTGWIVSACVEEDDATIWSFGDCFLHSGKVKAFCGFREVRIRSDGNGDIGKYLVVVGPGWVAEIDLGVARIEFGEEESTQMYCSCTRNGLEGACALFSEGYRIGTENKLRCSGCEGAQTGNGEVFVIQGGVGADDLLSLRVAISSYS